MEALCITDESTMDIKLEWILVRITTLFLDMVMNSGNLIGFNYLDQDLMFDLMNVGNTYGAWIGFAFIFKFRL